MTRLVATLAVALGLATFFFYLHHLGKGPFAPLAARHLREMKDRAGPGCAGCPPQAVEPMTHEAFLALPRDLSVADYSAVERRAVAIEGRVFEMLRAVDGDFHVELQPLPDSTRAQPLPSITTEITPQWHGDALDGWGFERLASIFRCDRALVSPWEPGPARVRLSGWLLYDGEESDLLPRLLGLPRTRRLTEWEIHPVTRIERWDETRLAWVEVTR